MSLLKKLLIALMVFSLLIFGGTPVAAAGNNIKIEVNGKPVNSDVAPFIKNSRTMVPLRFVAEALGAKVEWAPETRTVTVRYLEKVVVLPIGSTVARVNGSAVVLDVPAVIVSGRTFVPLRFIAEALGAIVRWDADTRTVEVVHGVGGPDLPERFRPPDPVEGPWDFMRETVERGKRNLVARGIRDIVVEEYPGYIFHFYDTSDSVMPHQEVKRIVQNAWVDFNTHVGKITKGVIVLVLPREHMVETLLALWPTATREAAEAIASVGGGAGGSYFTTLLPQGAPYMTIAHELTHLWQGELEQLQGNVRHHELSIIREGFAEFIAWLLSHRRGILPEYNFTTYQDWRNTLAAGRDYPVLERLSFRDGEEVPTGPGSPYAQGFLFAEFVHVLYAGGNPTSMDFSWAKQLWSGFGEGLSMEESLERTLGMSEAEVLRLFRKHQEAGFPEIFNPGPLGTGGN